MNNSKQEVTTSSAPTVVIRPSRGWIPINLRELWAYRELLYFLTWRDIKVRYKQTLLGFAWAVIQPFSMMIVFTLFFGTLAKIPSEGIPQWMKFVKRIKMRQTRYIKWEKGENEYLLKLQRKD